jgi:hypothetical protein
MARQPLPVSRSQLSGCHLSWGSAIDRRAESQDDAPRRSEAIRRLVELGLKAKGK